MVSAFHPFLSHRYRVGAAAAVAAFLDCQGLFFGREIIPVQLSASLRALLFSWVGHLGVEEQLVHGARCWSQLTLLLTAGPGCCWGGQRSGLSGGTHPGEARLCPIPPAHRALPAQAPLQLWPCGWCFPPCSLSWQWYMHQAPRQPVMQPGRGGKTILVYFTFYNLFLGN